MYNTYVRKLSNWYTTAYTNLDLASQLKNKQESKFTQSIWFCAYYKFHHNENIILKINIYTKNYKVNYIFSIGGKNKDLSNPLVFFLFVHSNLNLWHFIWGQWCLYTSEDVLNGTIKNIQTYSYTCIIFSLNFLSKLSYFRNTFNFTNFPFYQL